MTTHLTVNEEPLPPGGAVHRLYHLQQMASPIPVARHVRPISLPLSVILLAALAAGLALRLWFVFNYPQVSGDTLIYGDLAKNWLLHGVYGFSTATAAIRPTLIRLPGYPLFLAACFRIFGVEHYNAVLYVQVALDLLTCILVWAFAAEHLGRRAGIAALFLAALCPFTANYTAAPLTEVPSVFCIALALWSIGRYLKHPRVNLYFFLIALSLAFAILLRPDGALLAVSSIPAMLLRPTFSRTHAPSIWVPLGRRIRLALLCSLLALLPLIPWTLRNHRVFLVFQPLAPRYATDPGEYVARGFNLWTKTWCVDFASTWEVYWNGNSAPIDIHDLPARAFDTPAEYARTEALLTDYNEDTTLSPEIDNRFLEIAQERIRRSPFRFYVEMPFARLANMWLRPRTELLWIELRWWQYPQHPGETVFAWAYAGLNLLYLLLAVYGAAWGLIHRRIPLQAVMLAYILLRCALLLTLENSEMRYTLEAFPILFIFGAAALARPSPAEIVAA